MIDQGAAKQPPADAALEPATAAGQFGQGPVRTVEHFTAGPSQAAEEPKVESDPSKPAAESAMTEAMGEVELGEKGSAGGPTKGVGQTIINTAEATATVVQSVATGAMETAGTAFKEMKSTAEVAIQKVEEAFPTVAEKVKEAGAVVLDTLVQAPETIKKKLNEPDIQRQQGVGPYESPVYAAHSDFDPIAGNVQVGQMPTRAATAPVEGETKKTD